MNQTTFIKNDDFVKIPWMNYALRKDDVVRYFTRGLQVVIETRVYCDIHEIIGTFSDAETAEEAFKQFWEAMCI